MFVVLCSLFKIIFYRAIIVVDYHLLYLIEEIYYENLGQRAKRAGLEHTISINDIIIPDYCPVFGIKLETGDRKNHNNAPSIDRIDNNRGYVKDNIIVVSTRANILKKDASIDEIIMLAKFYTRLKEI